MALPFLILSSAARAPALADGPTVYRPGGAHRTFSAALALAIAGSVGAALVLALVAPAFVATEPDGTEIRHIPMPVDPPQPQTETKPAEPTRSVITVPPRDPYVETKEAPQVFRETFPPIDPGPVIGTETLGGGIALPVDPPRTPVFRAASRDPRAADRFQPAYPTSEIREGNQGRCPVSVTIAANGRVTAVRDNGCTSPAFFAATERQALRHWRFRPATRDGVAVESTQSLTVTFQIDE